MEKRKQGVEQSSHPIKTAVEVLELELEDIPNVKTWAERMGYSRSHFSTKIKEHFGKAPGQVLREVRVKLIRKEILSHPQETAYSIARRVGLKDDDALCHFLSTHFGTNFTELRENLFKIIGDKEYFYL